MVKKKRFKNILSANYVILSNENKSTELILFWIVAIAFNQ